MQIDFDFRPDAHRAQLLDRRMHIELATSLRYLDEECSKKIPYDHEALHKLIESLEQGDRYSPHLFGTYYQLVMRLFDENNEAAAEQFQQIVSFKPESEAQRVIPLKDPIADPKSRLYRELLERNASDNISFLPPTQAAVHNFQNAYRQAISLLEEDIPELAAEVAAIVREVVCVGGAPDSRLHFDGGSHYQLWGALFLNIDQPRTCYELIEVIAHESAHSLLFGFCTDETLVRNHDDELYDSPLRLDKRPMDGIYHATFVSARMHWAMSRLLDSPRLSDAERKHVESARTEDAKNFSAGYEVVAAHGDLTDTGRALMHGASSYMEENT